MKTQLQCLLYLPRPGVSSADQIAPPADGTGSNLASIAAQRPPDELGARTGCTGAGARRPHALEHDTDVEQWETYS